VDENEGGYRIKCIYGRYRSNCVRVGLLFSRYLFIFLNGFFIKKSTKRWIFLFSSGFCFMRRIADKSKFSADNFFYFVDDNKRILVNLLDLLFNF